MKTLIKLSLILMLGIFLSSCTQQSGPSGPVKEYKADWQSLRQHQTPEWLQEGKFGIVDKQHFATSPFINLANNPRYRIDNAESGFLTLVNEALSRGDIKI